MSDARARMPSTSPREDEQSFLLELSDALRALTDASAIEGTATRMLGTRLGARRVFYAQIEREAAVIRAPYTDGVAPLSLRIRAAKFLSSGHEAYRRGERMICHDVAREPRFSQEKRDFLRSIDVGAFVGVPLLKGENRVAVLGVHDSVARNWSSSEVALIADVAERTWAAVERAVAELALRESEQRARALLEEATAARTLAESANVAKDQFLATLSHELRTPLAAILLWSGAVRSGAVPLHELQRALTAIASSADSLSRLIEDLLDLSRLTSGKFTLAPTPLEVATVLESAVEIVKPIASARKLTFTTELDPNLGTALIDGARLKQIVWNLLTNATKFTEAGGSIMLRAHRRENSIELEVSDTGEGIEPEFVPHLFERFSQADMADTRRHMGLGIGLALVKQLVALHGGTIVAESGGRGRGSLFRVRLPWLAPPLSEPHETDGDSPVPTTTPLLGLRVLLVEDDPNTREAMSWALMRAGATVSQVATAQQALALQRGPSAADVIVSDLGMPEMSGFELIRRVVGEYRAHGRPPPASCAVSAHVRDIDRREAIDAGFDMYLPKPLSPEQLVEAVVDLREVLVRNRS